MSTLYDSLSEGVKKLKNQIYVLSAVFGILIVTADMYGKLTIELLAGLIIVYVIALYAAYYEDQRKRQVQHSAAAPEEKETEKQGIKWQILFPKSLPNPLNLGLSKGLAFSLRFNVVNGTKENQRVGVQIMSPTQAIRFEHDVETTKWHFKHGIIPARRRSKYWLDDFITAKISPGQQTEFNFHGIYAKLDAIDLLVGHRAIPVRYRVLAVGEDERTTIDSEVRRFEIPMERISKSEEKLPK